VNAGVLKALRLTDSAKLEALHAKIQGTYQQASQGGA